MKSRRDYQGREWIEPPPGAKKEDMACFLPKVREERAA